MLSKLNFVMSREMIHRWLKLMQEFRCLFRRPEEGKWTLAIFNLDMQLRDSFFNAFKNCTCWYESGRSMDAGSRDWGIIVSGTGAKEKQLDLTRTQL